MFVFTFLALFLCGNPALALTPQEELNQVNEQINSVSSKIAEARAQGKTLAGEIAVFDDQIYLIQLQINATQQEIDITNSEIRNTNEQIAAAEIELQKQKEIMSEYLKTMYIEGRVSTVELIAKSDNFSDFVDRSEYLSTMQDKVQETANKIVALKEELALKKKELEVKKEKAEQLRSSQTVQKQSLNNQRAEKDYLLEQTKGQEASFQTMLKDLYQQRAAISAKNNETIGGAGTGGYPYSQADPNGIDPWKFYYRQCTSYAAWKSANLGPVSAAILADWGSGHRANGGDWGYLGSTHGYTVDYNPTPGAIMSFPYGPGMPYGHVAIVESVNSDGTVNVSEYNWSTPLGFGTRQNVKPENYGAVFIH